MLDFITIFNLMKQQPEFSIIGSSLFIYLTYYWFKTQSKKKIEDIVKDIVKDIVNLHINPIKSDISEMNNRLGKIEQNICGK
jgi:hypothetical protein